MVEHEVEFIGGPLDGLLKVVYKPLSTCPPMFYTLTYDGSIYVETRRIYLADRKCKY